jgi:hypothetical protein
VFENDLPMVVGEDGKPFVVTPAQLLRERHGRDPSARSGY